MLTQFDIEALQRHRALVEDWCTKLVAPELAAAGTPLYLLTSSEWPELFAHDAECRGYTGRNTDLASRDRLQAAERWAGRGPCIVVHDVAILEELKAACFECDSPVVLGMILEVALHELAHVVVDGIQARPEPETFDSDHELTVQREFTAKPPETNQLKFVAMCAHAGPFHRVVIHLANRAVQLAHQYGAVFTLAGIASCETYRFSPATEYAAALGAELQDLTTPLSQILRRPYPEEFSRLVAQDVCAFLQSLKQDSA